MHTVWSFCFNFLWRGTVSFRKLFQQRVVSGSAQGIQLFLSSNSYVNMTASESKLVFKMLSVNKNILVWKCIESGPVGPLKMEENIAYYYYFTNFHLLLQK